MHFDTGMNGSAEPISFLPLCFSRVWGGDRLAKEFGKPVDDVSVPTGESWEVVDRTDARSVVTHGKHAGQDIHDLWTNHRVELFGSGLPDSERFPLLLKILDASDRLSIQVHPPADVAERLGGEPKTESWFLAGVDKDASLYVGFERPTSRDELEQAIAKGTVDEVVHELRPKRGEFIHLESGRLHAIGAGCLIFEIQQNSDTTYRVYDWGRLGLDGKPRELHVKESLECIDFDDVLPTMGVADGETLVECAHYSLEKWEMHEGDVRESSTAERFSIVAVVSGTIACGEETFTAGGCFIAPIGCVPMSSVTASEALVIRIP